MQRLGVLWRLVSVVFVLFLSGNRPADASLHRYVEDFGTKQYCDAASTTAWWDTIGGALKLHPFELTLAGSYDTLGQARGVALSGDYAYVANGASGLVVIDISDPTGPGLAGSYVTPTTASGVALSGDYAYVADWAGGLQVIDISNPTTPGLAGSCDTPGLAWGVAISGDYAYVADGDSGLAVIDISVPAAPAPAGSCITPDYAMGVAVSGDYVYVADRDSGLIVIDISDPSVPVLVGNYDTPDQALAVTISGDYAYVADGLSGVQVIDISNPTIPALAGSHDTPDYTRGIAVCGDYAYVADGLSGLQVIDISDPTTPGLIGSYDTPDFASGIAVCGEYGYVADRDSGLVVVDISDPTTDYPGYWPAHALVGSYNTPSYAYEVAVSGDFLYVADCYSGLQVIDISDPGSPALAGSYNTLDCAIDVAISGDYAFVADEDSGLVVLNITDPATPVLAGSYDTPSAATGVAISGDYAYVADGGAGLVVIDISDPTAPALAGSYDTPEWATKVAISGDYAYVSNEESGLQVIDITVPTAPALAGSYDTPDYATDVAVSGDYAYVTDGESGLQVIDISNPTLPTYAGSYDTPGFASGVAISGDYAFVGDQHTGLVVLDITNPPSPAFVGAYDMPDVALGVTISGDYACVADYGSGIYVVHVFERSLDWQKNKGQSLVVNQLDDDIRKVRLTTSQTDSIYWYASADSGAAWDEVVPYGNWHELTSPGGNLLWRSEHFCVQHDVNPTCSLLDIEWLYDFAMIDSIVDVPGDQGGWARVHFTRSALDFANEPTYPIARYDVLRRIDDVAVAARVVDEAQPTFEDTPGLSTPDETEVLLPKWIGGSPVLHLDGRHFVVFEESHTGSQPLGTWEVVLGMSSYQQDRYICLVPTLADSTSSLVHSVYCVAAHTTTPSVYYFSPPDSGYSVDNLCPDIPQALAGQYLETCQVLLHWNPNTEADLSHYAIYRGTTPDFVPSGVTLTGTVTDTFYVDGDYDPDSQYYYYYKVAAWDVHENEGPHALLEPEEITDVPGVERSYGNVLSQNVPNPFSSVTSIAFSIQRAGHVRVQIFDAKGRLVRVLADEVREPSRYLEQWDGRDANGKRVPAGTYFCRLGVPGWTAVKKMTFTR